MEWEENIIKSERMQKFKMLVCSDNDRKKCKFTINRNIGK
jgi:hypothetical protein